MGVCEWEQPLIDFAIPVALHRNATSSRGSSMVPFALKNFTEGREGREGKNPPLRSALRRASRRSA
ncbi:MAG: hypothetical protein ACI9OU_001214 [Candidatus Promineifilaceae bacterium]|jgi:hypothetical protein